MGRWVSIMWIMCFGSLGRGFLILMWLEEVILMVGCVIFEVLFVCGVECVLCGEVFFEYVIYIVCLVIIIVVKYLRIVMDI